MHCMCLTLYQELEHPVMYSGLAKRKAYCTYFLWHGCLNFWIILQSTSLITTLGGASKKCPYSRSVVIPEVSLYVLQLEGTLLWAWKCCRYSRIVVISAVVISEVDCIMAWKDDSLLHRLIIVDVNTKYATGGGGGGVFY